MPGSARRAVAAMLNAGVIAVATTVQAPGPPRSSDTSVTGAGR
jgi:hypothetical protein